MKHPRKAQRGFVVFGWLFLAASGWTVLNGPWDEVTPAVVGLVGIGLGCLLTAVVLAIEDLHRH